MQSIKKNPTGHRKFVSQVANMNGEKLRAEPHGHKAGALRQLSSTHITISRLDRRKSVRRGKLGGGDVGRCARGGRT